MWLQSVLRESWNILGDTAFYVLVGFVIAAFLHVWLSGGRLAVWLRRAGTRSVGLATLIGIPLPLCSCSALPAAMSLRRQGASKGSVLAFLISEPETSISSILLTYSLLGWPMAIIRPIAACFSAFVAGIVENLFDRRDRRLAQSAAPAGDDASAGIAHGSHLECDHPGHAHSHQHSHGLLDDPFQPPQGPRPRLVDGFRHAFVDIFDDIIGWLLASVLIAGAIKVLLPDQVLLTWLGNPWLAMIVLIAVGVPLYVCAEASTPIAAAFILKGVSPGAALAFLLAGPATNIGSIAILTRELGRRTIVVYLASIILTSFAAGTVVHLLDQRYGLVTASAGAAAGLPDGLRLGGVAILLALCIPSFLRLHYPERLLAALNSISPIQWSPTAARFGAVAAALVAYLLSGFASVQPYELGVVRRFGRIVTLPAEPGLHWVGPWPIGRMDRIAASSVRRAMLGEQAATVDQPATFDELTGWTWLGDENIAGVKYAVHWSVRPERLRQFAYGVAGVDRLIRSAAQTALREVLSTWTIDTIYTVGRSKAEVDSAKRLQALCDRVDCGVRIDAIRFLEVHAPAEVHAAFRDVASAVEERTTLILRAEGERAKSLPRARGDAMVRRTDARIRVTELLARARGEATAFTARHQAAGLFMDVTRTRLYFETLDAVLPRLRSYIRMDDAKGRPIEFWLRAEPERPASAAGEPR